ncbi:hypothetical protein OG900_10910 [Streptomyces sp. NBC_00433]
MTVAWRRTAATHQGRGELRDQPTTGARVVTDPEVLLLSKTDHRPVAG